MRSFRDFLREEDPCWKGYKQVGMKKKGKRKVPNCVPVNEAWKYSEKTHQTYSGPETVKQHTHTTTIDGKKVEVGFGHNVGYHDEGTWDVHFAVNHDMEAPRNTHPSTAKKILKHVGNVTKSFIQKHNPKELTWSATDLDKEQSEKKGRIYKALAKKHGAKIKEKGLKNVFGGGEASLKLREEWSYEKKHRPAFNMTSNFAHHDAEIDGHKVRTTFVNSTHSPKQHTVSFTVDGNLSAEKGKAHKASTAKKIIQHVRGITKEYIAKHNPHEINFSGMDEDPKKQKVKNVIYQRLAKKAGAKITSKDTGEFVQNRIKLREEWKRKENGPDGEHEITHTSTIGKHEVQVKFEHDPIEKPHDHGDYELSFSVNNKMSAHGKGKEHAVKIFKHVTDKVKEFKQTHKPKSISYMASDEDGAKTDKKDHIYSRMAKRLIGSAKAKHTVEPGWGGWSDTHKFEFSEGRDSPEHGFHSISSFTR